MQVLPSFDPSLVMNGKINASSVDPGSKILLYNLSIYTLQLNFDNGDSALIHAFEANYWILDGSTTSIDWIQYDKLNTTQPASSKVTATAYRSDEEITGIYPMSLTYQVSVGNTITTSQGSTLSIQNDGNVAATSLIEATPQGDGASAVSLTVAGVFALGNATHHGSISFDNATITSDGAGNLTVKLLTATGITVSGTVTGATLTATGTINGVTGNITGTLTAANVAAGSISSSGGYTQTGGDMALGTHNITSANQITASTLATNQLQDSGGGGVLSVTPSTVTRVQTGLGGTIAFQVNAVSQASVSASAFNVTPALSCTSAITANGGFILGGTTFNYGLYKNSISRVNSVNFTPGAVTGSVAHGLGGLPSFPPIIWCTDASSTATCAVTSFDATNVFYRVFTASIQYSIFAMRY